MARAGPRAQSCSRDDATTRLEQARKFLEVAELTATEDAVPASASVAAALAVLAGIAAADAACCAALGQRARGQAHHQAEQLLAQVSPGGPEASTVLHRLLDLKDTAHYGLIHVSGAKLKAALRQAAQLISYAETVVRR